MAPHISRNDVESFPKLYSFLHPGIGKSTFKESNPQPHVFQQSVTLTASIWNENESEGNMENWNFGSGGVFGEYSPLFVGLVCGFGIVLILMSTVMLWRYCLLSATKKVCCSGTYGEITQHQKSLPQLRKTDNENGFEHFKSKSSPIGTQPTLQRSATVCSMSWHDTDPPLGNEINFSGIPRQGKPLPNRHLQSTAQFEPLMSQDVYTSHLYLEKLGQEGSKNLSRSTPALEDLYAKVNFSKKKKNRMRKDDAAVIAMSKSHSGQNNNSLTLFGSAVVVYNERTAL